MKYLKKFESNNSWCDLDNPIGIEVRNTIKEILAELIEDGFYTYKLLGAFNNKKIGQYLKPRIWIAGEMKNDSLGLNRYTFNIEKVRPFIDQIVSYLNSEGFKTDIKYISFGNKISEVDIDIEYNEK